MANDVTCLYCSSPVLALGLCNKHWQRWYWRRPMEIERVKKGWLDNRGYRWIMTPDGREMMEHRYVMERVLGRRLTPDEVVHHRDGIKTHNDPSNLELMTQQAHTSHHRPHRKPCFICGIDDDKQIRGACNLHYRQLTRELLRPFATKKMATMARRG